MKNIHVLPTDKPSRLGYLTKKGKEVFKDLRLFDQLMPNILDSENQNIYITSDEEIKEGDWVYSEARKTWFKAKSIYNTSAGYLLIEDDAIMPLEINEVDCKKIILTTDTKLIQDGVQKINDNFLEWFVKNKSCETIKIEKIVNDYWKKLQLHYKFNYKIIIPKKELKQLSDLEIALKLEEIEREETLVEFTKDRLCGMFFNNNLEREIAERFIFEGAKWQQENILQLLKDNDYQDEAVFELLTEQFKKK